MTSRSGPDTMTREYIKKIVESFICSELVSGGFEDTVPDDARLISDGIIDSMASLRLVSFLEETFDVSIKTYQLSANHLDTLDLIAKTVMDDRVER